MRSICDVSNAEQTIEDKTEEEKQETLSKEATSFYTIKFAVEPRGLIVVDRSLVKASDTFLVMVNKSVGLHGVDLQELVDNMMLEFGSHVCLRTTMGGQWSLQASYQASSEIKRSEMSTRNAKAIERQEEKAWSQNAAGGGFFGWGAAAVEESASGGSGTATKTVVGSGARDVSSAARENDTLTVNEHTLGGSSGAGPGAWRDSLATNSNWRVINRDIRGCVGNRNFIPRGEEYRELRLTMANTWLQKTMGLSKSSIRSVIRDGELDTLTRDLALLSENSCERRTVCPPGFRLKSDAKYIEGSLAAVCCEKNLVVRDQSPECACKHAYFSAWRIAIHSTWDEPSAKVRFRQARFENLLISSDGNPTDQLVFTSWTKNPVMMPSYEEIYSVTQLEGKARSCALDDNGYCVVECPVPCNVTYYYYHHVDPDAFRITGDSPEQGRAKDVEIFWSNDLETWNSYAHFRVPNQRPTQDFPLESRGPRVKSTYLPARCEYLTDRISAVQLRQPSCVAQDTSCRRGWAHHGNIWSSCG